MALHLIKLCVGCDSIEDLADWQAERLKARRKAGEKRPQLETLCKSFIVFMQSADSDLEKEFAEELAVVRKRPLPKR